jgi:hypothetical protein
VYTFRQEREVSMLARVSMQSVRLGPLSRLGASGLLGLVLGTGPVSPAAPISAGPEARAYLEAIRQDGMSELARLHLSQVSSVLERVILLDFLKVDDVYLTDWVDRFCGVPGAAQNPLVVAAQKGIAVLRPLADLDRSGFVSTEEASRFKQLFELGRAVPFVLAREKTTDAATVARFLRLSVPELAADYAEYPSLTARSGKLFPPLPTLQGLPASRPAPLASTEFPAYRAAVERSGLSELAHQTLQGIAMLRTGAVHLSFVKDPETGRYNQVNRRIEKDAARREAMAEPELPGLRPLADFDGSGFVTSEESSRLRRLFLLGRRVAAVAEKEGTDGRTVATAVGAKLGDLKAELAEYEQQSARLKGDLLAPVPALRF